MLGKHQYLERKRFQRRPYPMMGIEIQKYRMQQRKRSIFYLCFLLSSLEYLSLISFVALTEVGIDIFWTA